MVINIINTILPIIVVLALGMAARRRGWFDGAGVKTMKGLVSQIMLPVILFNAFVTAEYSIDTVKIIVIIFFAMLAEFGLAHLVKKVFKVKSNYYPFLASSIEGGTIGYPLLGMLFGAVGTMNMAIFDVGHTAFLFAISIPLLQVADGKSPDPKALVKSVVTSPTFDAMVLGVIGGVCGLDVLLDRLGVMTTFSSLVSFITAPAGMLILLCLGYEMSFKGEHFKKVVATALSKLVLMGLVCALTLFIITRLVTLDTTWIYCIIFAFSLPASYALFMFADFKGEEEYVATTISFSTLLTLIIFMIITIVSA